MSKLKRSASMPNKKYSSHKVAKIFQLPIEIQCQVFKTIDIDDFTNVIASNATLKRNVTSCVENIIIKNDNTDLSIILNSNLPRLKNIVHRNGHLYKYVNKAIDDKNFKLLEFLLKYGKFCQGTCQYCNFAEDVKALKLALKYKFINLKDTSEMTEALKMAAIRGNTNAIKMLLGYSFKHKIQFSFASVLNRAKRIRNENILKLLENFYSKNHDLDNTNVDYAQYH